MILFLTEVHVTFLLGQEYKDSKSSIKGSHCKSYYEKLSSTRTLSFSVGMEVNLESLQTTHQTKIANVECLIGYLILKSTMSEFDVFLD